MPPEERFLPRFAAEPPLEELPYGRWAERLTGEFLAACLALDAEGEDLGEPGEITWYPDRTWHGRTYVPGTSITANGYELFGYIRFVPAALDGDPSDFSAHVDFTEETAERNPDWTLDLCDEVIGAWRGHAGAVAAMTLITSPIAALFFLLLARDLKAKLNARDVSALRHDDVLPVELRRLRRRLAHRT